MSGLPGVDMRSSLYEIALALHRAGKGPEPDPGLKYPWTGSDLDFEICALDGLRTPGDAEALCRDLDSDAVSAGGPLERCGKARQIRAALAAPDPWSAIAPRDTRWLRRRVSEARRITCLCHESFYFARRRWP